MIDLHLPEIAIVRGGLCSDMQDPSWLTQDILEVLLPNRVVIDVGWYPEHDLNGKFWIRAFLGDWDNQLITPIHEHCPVDVKEVVERLAWHFNRHKTIA